MQKTAVQKQDKQRHLKFDLEGTLYIKNVAHASTQASFCLYVYHTRLLALLQTFWEQTFIGQILHITELKNKGANTSFYCTLGNEILHLSVCHILTKWWIACLVVQKEAPYHIGATNLLAFRSSCGSLFFLFFKFVFSNNYEIYPSVSYYCYIYNHAWQWNVLY